MEGEASGAAAAGKRKRAKKNRGLKKKQEGQRYQELQARRQNEDKPDKECRDEVLREIYKFFMEHPMSFFILSYLQYTVEVGKAAFSRDITELVDRVVDTDKWRNQKMKSGYTVWIEHRINDAMWNGDTLVDRFAREAEIINSAEYEETKAKLKQWHEDTRRWRSRGGHRPSETQLKFRGDQLVYLADTADVHYFQERYRGGFGDVTRCHIKNDPSFPEHMMLASKVARNMPKAQKTALFNSEALAVRSPHRGCIKWIAVHHTNEEGFTEWWNGGTIRTMLNDNNMFGEKPADSAFMWQLRGDVRFKETSFERAHQVAFFRKQRMELAWTLLNIMNNIHQSHILHNDLSPDNILLHFEPQFQPQHVYIGVCDWGLSTNSANPRESPYWASSLAVRDVERSPRKGRWWIAPELYYFPPAPGSSRDADFDIKPRHTF